MNQKTNESTENEVELGNFTNRISNFFDFILQSIFSFIQLLWRNKWIAFALIVLGVTLGLIENITSNKKFKSEVFVAANFNSNEYLYTKVNNFAAMKEAASTLKDSILLGGIARIDVEPVYNGYDFLLSSYQNMEAFKILTEKGIDLEKYLKSKIAEKSYRYYKITMITDIAPDSTDWVINHFLKKVNETPYFEKKMQFEKQNLKDKRVQLQKSVDQLNGMFESFGNTPTGSTVTSNDYSDMDKLFMSKEYLLNQINYLDAEILESDKVIYDVFRMVNKSYGFPIKSFIYLPFMFLLLFGFFVKIKGKYTKFTQN